MYDLTTAGAADYRLAGRRSETMMPLTRALGTFAAGLRFEMLPEKAVEAVKLGFTDCVAVMLAGAREPVAKIVTTSMVQTSADGEARLFLRPVRASAIDAALANGVAAHALDYDDVALAGHPSTVLVPAILAEAEAVGADGRAAVTAYVAGYETWARLVEREPDPYHRKGWHPTAVMGPVAAAAAIASLRRLDAERATTALGIGASMAGGIVANFGTMTKPFHAGRAAAAGVAAARLAAAGMTASADAIEHQLGLLAALSPHGRADRETPLDALGQSWRIVERGLNVKKYPICYATHRSIDAIIDLVRTHDLSPAAVAGIDVTIGATQCAMLRNHRPQTGLEAKFSMEFAMASALVARRVGLSELTTAFVQRPEVQNNMGKVRISSTDTVSADDPIFSASDRVDIELTDGGRLASPEIRFARGHWSMPLRPEELWMKFSDCAAGELGGTAAHALFADLQTLERMGDLRRLCKSPALAHA
jgi:aconitate decarboxylase